MFKNDSHSENDTVIGPSVTVEGDFSSQGNINIEGALSGTIETAANLVVGEHARLVANVKAQNAHIAGYLKGNLVVAERLELAPTSHIEGDVMAKVLVVTEGARLDGRCQMSAATAPATSTNRSTNKKAAAAVVEQA